MGWFFDKTLGNLGKKVLLNLAVPLAEDALPTLATKGTSSVLDKFERKINGQGAVRAGRGFILFISNKDTDDIDKIVESPQKSDLLINGASKIVKHKIKKPEGGFLGAIFSYSCFIDCYCSFFIDKCSNWMRG